MNQLARVVCGCWIDELPEAGTLRLLRTLTLGWGQPEASMDPGVA